MEKLRGGDPLAFERLVREHSPRMLTVARRFMKDDADAADALQDAFVSAFRAIGSFDGKSSLSTWLHSIVIRACLMRLRSRRRRPESRIDDLLPQFDETGHRIQPGPAWAEPIDQVVLRKESREIVRQCIDLLPDTHRTVLLMRDIEELGTEETARMLGVNAGVVKTRLHRARQALRTLLEPHFGRAGGITEVAEREECQ
jgi:RNA polymerase sigma-70 factor (ECF subfamily)